MKFQEVPYTVPSHWLCAIINGDETSLDDDSADYAAYKAFCEHEIRDATVDIVSDEGYFAPYHDATGYGVLACDVHDCIFLYPIAD